MIITVEISYYPLCDEHSNAISTFLKSLSKENIEIEVGAMSSLISGEYDNVFKELTTTIKSTMEKYPSVFNIKLSNACIVR